MKPTSPRRGDSPNKSFKDDSQYTEKIALLEGELQEAQRSKFKLLKEIVALKKGQYVEEIIKLRKEMSEVKAAIEESSKNSEIIEQLRAENDQLLQIRNQHETDMKLIEECKTISQKGDASEAFYDKLDRLEEENAELRRKLAEQKESNDEIFEKAEDAERIGIIIKNSDISFTPKEVLIALKFRLHQLQDEHDALVDEEEDYEEEEINEEDVQELRKRISQLELRNAQLNKVASPNSSNTASPQKIESIIREINSIKEKNEALRASGASKGIGKTKEYQELTKIYQDLLNRSPSKQDANGIQRLFKAIEALTNRVDAELSSDEYSITDDNEKSDKENDRIENLKAQIEHLQSRLEVLDRKEAPADAATLFRENRELREEIIALKNQLSQVENIEEPMLGERNYDDYPFKFDRKGFNFYDGKNEVVFNDIEEEDQEEDFGDAKEPFRSNVDIDNDEPIGKYEEEKEEEEVKSDNLNSDDEKDHKTFGGTKMTQEDYRRLMMKTLSQQSDHTDSEENDLGVEWQDLTDEEEEDQEEESIQSAPDF
ncbi:hypothetical protein TVAG_347400 [Trichomonas vaginalis G3]|uniref:Uncharacterized protein n=1 Tax=Trichomonas vaginalis (strain ATCC PRA-98 / G3) TaxID=412133 RepID=A2FNQ2_TRIV3|nr:hypothetical protein TVAGG3_0367410 [Trichomonas vaginalis G3]EAX93453.1 hypothetical protein TVAG_347400 [Trichomonas vaginalis G3]KAI5532369.1 hypothetical protein TVAGG3_0367410 [Trichomonas vaginalis G3]|eukprot:XP_001306383.1 hypothetical protein [Trichomonas vaginalis G3]